MACVDLRLASGKSVLIDSLDCATIRDARCKIGEQLGMPTDCVSLVTSTGLEPNDDDCINLIGTGVTTIIIDYAKRALLLETPFLQACGVTQITDLMVRNRLECGNKNLSVLPESIGQLTALEGLYLNNNQLAAVPESIGHLTALKELHLHNNQLAWFRL